MDRYKLEAQKRVESGHILIYWMFIYVYLGFFVLFFKKISKSKFITIKRKFVITLTQQFLFEEITFNRSNTSTYV